MKLSPYKKAMMAACLAFGIRLYKAEADRWADEKILEAEYKLIQNKQSSLSSNYRKYVVWRYERRQREKQLTDDR